MAKGLEAFKLQLQVPLLSLSMVPPQPSASHPRRRYPILYVKNGYLCYISAVVQAVQNTGSINRVTSGLAAAPSSTAFTTFTTVGTFTTEGKTETSIFTVTSSRATQATGSTGQSSNASVKNNTAAIAGGALGGAIILTLLAVSILFFLRRSRRIRTKDVTTPNTDVFRPVSGTGRDIESNRINAVGVASNALGGPFVKPMTQTGPRLNVQRSPVPDLLPKPPSVSEDPSWDTSPENQFEQVLTTPAKVEVNPVAATDADPFVDHALIVPLQSLHLTPHSDGPSRLSTASSQFDSQVEKPAQDPFVDSALAVPHLTPHSDGPSRLSIASSQFDSSVRQSSTAVSSFCVSQC